MRVFGIRLVGFTAENGHKLLLTLGFLGAIWLLRLAVRWLVRRLFRGRRNDRLVFWARQAVSLAVAVLAVVAVLSIWFDDPGRLATGIGLFTAGLAFALQKVVTSFAGYLLIMRGRTFNVGDRISMGGVRGDVIALGFIQTTILEMGQPPEVQSADPAMWVGARQFTGRIVTVTNDKVFEEPVFNYTREFPFIWEELRLPVRYADDRRRAEQVLLEAVRANTEDFERLSEPDKERFERKFGLRLADLAPRVFLRITDNWVELTARFLVREHGIRVVKDAISRQVLEGLDRAGIGVASATYEITGVPALEVRAAPAPSAAAPAA